MLEIAAIKGLKYNKDRMSIFDRSRMKEINNEMKNYLNLAKTGYYPLFFSDWLNSDIKDAEPMTFRMANRNVREVFKKLSKHRSSERKKIALTGLEEKERKIFIRSFIKVVEHDLLKDIKSLH
jgi:DNA-nicking Smr family endonuclease